MQGGVGIELAFVGMEPQFPRDVFPHNLGDGLLVGDRHMECADVPTALDQGDDGALVGGPRAFAPRIRATACRLGPNFGFLDGAVIGFVGLDDLAFAAKRAKPTSAHSFADAMAHEPSRLVVEMQGTV